MDIYINNSIQYCDSAVTLSEILGQLQLDEKKGIAVAVNEQVITKTSWDSHILQHQDKITIITATQGG